MNRWGKTLLVGSSLTPIFLVCGVHSLRHGQLESAYYFGLLFLLATTILFYLMYSVRSRLPKQTLTTQKVKPSDKEVLAFLLSYLLPFYSRESVDFKGELFTAIAVVIIIGLVVYHSNAYTFNPVLACIGYHFYEVESGGMTYLLISGKPILTPDNTLTVRNLCGYIFISEE